MTTRNRLRLAFWIVLIATAGLAGTSYLHAYHTRLAWSDSRLVAVSIIDGNLRMVHLSAEFDMSYVQDSPLEEYADHWKLVTTNALIWYRSNQISFKEASIRYVAFGGSLIPPILASLLVVWAIKRRRLIAASIREIMTPSDRHSVKLLRRVIRRSVVVIFGLATLLAVGSWVICYAGLRTPYSRQLYQNTLGVLSPYRGNYYVKFKRSAGPFGPFQAMGLSAGRVTVRCRSLVAQGTTVPTYDVGLGGFRWSRRSIRSGHSTVEVEIPCWAPVLLFSAWPIIAFIRGPYRRVVRRAKGFCIHCGYNLTGLAEPRCPECGTPTCAGPSLRSAHERSNPHGS